jgi:hypothetical protein
MSFGGDGNALTAEMLYHRPVSATDLQGFGSRSEAVAAQPRPGVSPGPLPTGWQTSWQVARLAALDWPGVRG